MDGVKFRYVLARLPSVAEETHKSGKNVINHVKRSIRFDKAFSHWKHAGIRSKGMQNAVLTVTDL